MMILLSILALIALWMFLTWWNDDEKTFKSVVQDMFRDVADIAAPVIRFTSETSYRLWRFFGPRITNLPTMAVIALDVYAVATPELRDVIANDHWGAMALLALNLAARLSPRNAPPALPSGAAMGPGATAGF